MRLRSDIWISAMRKNAETKNAFVHIIQKGQESAGAIFIIIRNRENKCWLYAPEPSENWERKFTCVSENKNEEECRTKLEREMQFDPDLWVVEIEHENEKEMIEILLSGT